jgi:hypothetical protein
MGGACMFMVDYRLAHIRVNTATLDPAISLSFRIGCFLFKKIA